jgi:hypothetical protein
MAQNARAVISQAELSKFEEFIQIRSQYPKLVDPTVLPLNERRKQSIPIIIEGIDRVSLQGILVPAIASHLHQEYSRHAAMVCNEYQDTMNQNTYACWVKVAAEDQKDRLLGEIRCPLERVPPAITRNLLLDVVQADLGTAQACLATAKVMSGELMTALSEIESTFQNCDKMLGELSHLVECQCSPENANEEFLRSCCEGRRQISARREQMHITFRTIIRVVEQVPRWETRRDALRALNKLYWKCKNCNIFLRDGEWGTDVVKMHLIDLMGGLGEEMGILERQRYMDEGFSFNVLDSLEGKLYESLNDLKWAADNLRARSTPDGKDATTLINSPRQKPRHEATRLGDKPMSNNAGVKKAETKRLKRRRAKDRKALQKALANLTLGGADEHSS